MLWPAIVWLWLAGSLVPPSFPGGRGGGATPVAPGPPRTIQDDGAGQRPPRLDPGYLPYRFVRVASTRNDRFSEFLSVPSINDTGATAFVAVTKTGATGVFIGSGGPTSQVASNHGRFDAFGDWAVIGNGWQVLFEGTIQSRGTGLFYRRPGQLPEVVADTLQTFTRLEGPVAMNAGGLVAFHAEIDEIIHQGYIPPEHRPVSRLPDKPVEGRDQLPAYDDRPPEGIFVQDATGKTLVAVDTLTRFRQLEPDVALGDDGTLVFVGRMRSGETGVYVQGATGTIRALVTNRLRYKEFGPPAIDPEGFVAFWSELKNGAQGLYLVHALGGGIRELLLTRPGAEEAIDPQVGLARSGLVAYVQRRGGVPALTVRRGKKPPVIILSGNRALPEGRVADLRLGSKCLAARGHVAFLVRFTDGSSAIYMAVPTE